MLSPNARIRIGEEFSSPMPFRSSLKIDQLHGNSDKSTPELELHNPGFPSPTIASVLSAIVRSQVVSSASIPCQESLPASNRPPGRASLRHRKVARIALSANTKPTTFKLASSPDVWKLSIGERNGIPCDKLSRDNI